MSSPAEPRPLSLRPFLVADGVLLLTALLIAWRTPDELRGGALLAVVFCSALGAVLMVLPFILAEIRRREAELAARQRELAELVNVTNANASRWGTQWTAAATGLEDAASLATRSLAAAERLPAMFEEQAVTLSERLARAETDAGEREARAEERERRALAREQSLIAREEAFATRLENILARLEEQRARTVETTDRALAELGRAESGLSARQNEFLESIGAFAELSRETRRVPERLEDAMAKAGAAWDAHALHALSRFDASLASASDAVVERLQAVEQALQAATALADEAARRLENTVIVVNESSGRPRGVASAGSTNEQPVASAKVAATEARTSTTVVEQLDVVPTETGGGELRTAASKPIMDPFYIPEDGYSALAAAMDAGKNS